MYQYDPEQITFFAKTDARGKQVPFGIKANDRTRHVYVIGKTGMGKSTLLENMAAQDLKNGNGLAFIDPHGQTAETLLNYIPEERKDDVLYFAPFDTDNPISFNVMEDVGADKRHLVVSGLMSVFKKIWVDAWSARMEYILSNTLLALLEYPDSTLLGVNRMLSDKDYRKKVIDNITDPAVKSFWVDEFLKYNERYMQEAGDAIKNKIGQFTSNPLIRNIIGQPRTSFNIREVMDERKIMIINLSKGLVGEQNANLLGSMMTTRIYLAAMSRADLAPEELKQKPNFYFYVDEFQSFANATFADILSEARKYKLNLTIAHQYIEQMEEEVRNAVFGNVGTLISFRVGPFDAEVLETVFTPKFTAPDIVNLGFAQIYLTLMIDGIGSAPFSAVTLPPIQTPENSARDSVIQTSRTQFSRKRGEVEESIHSWHEQSFSDKPPYVPKHMREKADGGELPNTGENLKKYGVDGVAPKEERNTSAEAGSSNGSKGTGAHEPAQERRNGNGGRSNGGRDRARNGNGNSNGKGNGNGHKNDNGGRRENGKSLDELRSVLKGISQDGNGNGKSEIDNGRGPNKDARDENGNIKKDSDALKGALAAALGAATAAGLTSKEEEKDPKQADISLNAEDHHVQHEAPSDTLKQVAQEQTPEEKTRDTAIDGLEGAVAPKEVTQKREAASETVPGSNEAQREDLGEGETPKKKRRRRRKKKNNGEGNTHGDSPAISEAEQPQEASRHQEHNSRPVEHSSEAAQHQTEQTTEMNEILVPNTEERAAKADTETHEQPLHEQKSEQVEEAAQTEVTMESHQAETHDTQGVPGEDVTTVDSKNTHINHAHSTAAVGAAAGVAIVAAHHREDTPKAQVPYAQTNDYAQAKNKKTVDPLEPKKLERMMRVTTSDKLPLK